MFVKLHNHDHVNNSVISRFLKVNSDVDDVTVGDRLFTNHQVIYNFLEEYILDDI